MIIIIHFLVLKYVSKSWRCQLILHNNTVFKPILSLNRWRDVRTLRTIFKRELSANFNAKRTHCAPAHFLFTSTLTIVLYGSLPFPGKHTLSVDSPLRFSLTYSSLTIANNFSHRGGEAFSRNLYDEPTGAKRKNLVTCSSSSELSLVLRSSRLELRAFLSVPVFNPNVVDTFFQSDSLLTLILTF